MLTFPVVNRFQSTTGATPGIVGQGSGGGSTFDKLLELGGTVLGRFQDREDLRLQAKLQAQQLGAVAQVQAFNAAREADARGFAPVATSQGSFASGINTQMLMIGALLIGGVYIATR